MRVLPQPPMTLCQQQPQQQGVASAPTVREIFKVSGPRYLTAVDWENASHRRSVVASLVQGVNVLERDRQSGRAGTARAEAEPWWTFFHFQLLHVMADQQQQEEGQGPVIFGAVYGYAGPKDVKGGPPQTVIAFRGTMRRAATLLEDIKTDIAIVTGSGFHASHRFRVAMEALRRYYYASAGPGPGPGPAVALAGHSMGAAIAMQAARKLLEERGLPVEAHLFSPPFAAAPLGRIPSARVRRGMHVAGGVLTAGLAMALKGSRKRAESQRRFFAAADWVPWIYVNPRDDLCAGYVGHFEKQRHMMRLGAGAGAAVASLAAQHSVGGLLLSSVLRADADAGSMHLIPSATLVVAVGPRPAPDFKRAHGIHQWWAPDLVVDVQHCRIPEPFRG